MYRAMLVSQTGFGSQLFYRVRRCLTSDSRGRHGTVKEATEPSREEAKLRYYHPTEERY